MRYAAILLLASLPALAQEKWTSTCTTEPDACRQKIVPMAAAEKRALADAEAKAKAAQETAAKAERERDAVADGIVKAHRMNHLPASTQHLADSWGGTCTGTITFNTDGYIVYQPSADIESCGNYHAAKWARNGPQQAVKR